MHDGLHYYLHLLSDLTHLGAAGARTGALVAFAILLMRRNEHNAQSVIVISDSPAKFATAGTVIVVALILSALVNYLYIAEGNLTPLFNSSSGEDIACQDGSVCSDASSGCSKPVSPGSPA